jgi:hypothetical protein
MDKSWNSASTLIIERADEFGEKAELLAQANTWDRKNVDIKRIINEVAQIVDTKPIHWTVRVGQVLGRSRPQGQVAEYLGQAVVDALWPTDA